MSNPLKKALRSTMKQIRSELSTSYRHQASVQICKRIKALDHYRKAKYLGLYSAIPEELDLHLLWSSAPLHGRFCYFPVVQENKSLIFLPATHKTAFKTNRYGILEPDVSLDLALPVESFDIILVPLLAFDSQCRRLGMGGGYYDRSLNKPHKGQFLGVAYPFQKVDFIHADSWDLPLDGVVTSEGIYYP